MASASAFAAAEAAARDAAHAAYTAAGGSRTAVGMHALYGREHAAQAGLLRDLIGPVPFRRVLVQSAWLTWHDGVVVKLAQAAYGERRFPSGELDPARLAVLADALEDAGCVTGEIHSHCREQGRLHVRGCWLVDLLLGRA